MYDFLKNLAEDNNWNFDYSHPDYQNLYTSLEIQKVHLFLEPITTESSFSATGNEILTFSGRINLVVNSDVDESYSDKYTNHILPLKNVVLQIIKDGLICSEYTINKFQILEAINIYDNNYDGLLITYNITNNE